MSSYQDETGDDSPDYNDLLSHTFIKILQQLLIGFCQWHIAIL